MEKLIYTWEQQIDDTNLICAKIEADGFKPDVIVGISRGGLIPGVMISHKLNIPFKPVHASTRDFPHWENYLPKSNDSKGNQRIATNFKGIQRISKDCQGHPRISEDV